MLWDVATGKLLRACTDFRGGVRALVFAHDGNTLASAHENGSVVTWDVAACKKRRTFSGQRGAGTSVALSRDGKVLASGNTDKSILLWDNSPTE